MSPSRTVARTRRPASSGRLARRANGQRPRSTNGRSAQPLPARAADRADRRRIALVIEYDGTRLLGSQVQRRSPTVQGLLEEAVRRLTGERLRVAFAGRTDAGVHARGQVAAFTTSSRHAPETFVRALNAHLPDDVAVQRAAEVPADFDPRRHAERRGYRYTVYNAPVRSPLERDRAWHVPEPLDAARMAKAGAYLVGEHDFASFSRREPATTVRRVHRCDVARSGPFVTIDIEANAFLRQQVRRTAGALVEVGRRKLTLPQFRRLLSRPQPNAAGPVAPAHGLCLLRVAYRGLDLTPPNALS